MKRLVTVGLLALALTAVSEQRAAANGFGISWGLHLSGNFSWNWCSPCCSCYCPPPCTYYGGYGYHAGYAAHAPSHDMGYAYQGYRPPAPSPAPPAPIHQA